MFLVRMFDHAKWESAVSPGAEPSADAITGSLRTTRNALSVWAVPEKTMFEDGVLAVAAGRETVEKCDIVLIDEERLKQTGLSIEATAGKTPVDRLRTSHRDIVGLTYSSLGVVANLVAEGLRRGQFHRLTKAEVRRLLERAISDGDLKPADLNKKLCAELKV